MLLTDISKEARNTLGEMYVLRKYAEDEELDLDEVLQNFMVNIYLDSKEESDKFIASLKELKIKEFIKINIDVNENLEEIPSIESLELTNKAELYILKYMVYNGGLDIETRSNFLSLSDVCKTLSENGIYIIIIAIIPILCMVIDTILNTINTFR